MTVIEDSVVRAGRSIGYMHFEGDDAENATNLLVDLMHYCDATRGVSWARCVEAARRQYQKEVREAADATPLEEVTGTVPRK